LDDDLRDKWLKKSNRQLGDLKAEKKLLWTTRLMNNTEVQRFLGNGMIYRIELIEQYRKKGLTGLENALEAYKQEFDDMKRELRIPFVISTGIYSIIGDLQDELGDFKGSKELRIHIKDQIQNLVGVNHPYYLASVQDVVKSYWKLRELKEAEALLQENLPRLREVCGVQHPNTIVGAGNLVRIFTLQGKWKEAEELGL